MMVMYDPLSTVAAGSGFTRTAFADNKIPLSMQSPISRNLMAFFPHSNTAGIAYTHVNNWVSSPNIGKYGYNAWYSKFDYVWNQNHRTIRQRQPELGLRISRRQRHSGQPRQIRQRPVAPRQLRLQTGPRVDGQRQHGGQCSRRLAALHQLQRAGTGRRVRRFQARLEGPDRIVPRHPLSAVGVFRLPHHGDRRIHRKPYLLARPVLHAERRCFQNSRAPPAQDGYTDRRDAARTATPPDGRTATSLSTAASRSAIRRPPTAPAATASRRSCWATWPAAIRTSTRRAAPCSAPTAYTSRTTSPSPRS